jgi:DNA-binding winged helix-turn-helix (wHTH) protein
MRLFRFGVFEVDDAGRELRKSGRLIHAAAQPLSVLVALVERAGDVVTRGELRDRLWGDATHVEFDRSLNFCVSALRAALGDSARHPRFVETLPRRGYRFLADVQIVDSGSSQVAGAVKPRARGVTRWLRLVAAGVLCVQLPAVVRAHTRDNARPEALAAFELGLRSYGDGPDGREHSLAAFTRAVRLDARFAEAHFALADTFVALARQRAAVGAGYWSEARESLSRALRLEETAATHLLSASIAFEHDWQWREAEAHLERALVLAPDSDLAWSAYARLLSAEGRDGDAVAAIRRAQAASGCELVAFDAAGVFSAARMFPEALAAVDAAAEAGAPAWMSPDEWRGRLQETTLLIHAASHDWIRAKSLAVEMSSPDQRPALSNLNNDVAVRRFFGLLTERLQHAAIRGQVGAARMARLSAAAGQIGDALGWLSRAAVDRDPELPGALRAPAFNELRGTRQFADIEHLVRADLAGVK